MTVCYDGTNFSGYQKQGDLRTVQEELEAALFEINDYSEVSIYSSGRTDKGVHALNQKIHFDLDMEIPLYNLKCAINSKIGEDIYVKTIEEVEYDFHARYDVKSKEYIYKINIGDYNPLMRNYVFQYNKNLDINSMKKAIKYFIGEHDFSSFTKPNPDKDNFVRNIYSASIEEKDNVITISFVGSGFLRYMVRNMVGYLIEVGSGKREVSSVKDVIESKNRTNAGIMAPPCGLYLKDVKY